MSDDGRERRRGAPRANLYKNNNEPFCVSRQKTRERQNIVVPARPLRETGVPTLTMHAARAPVLRPLGAAPARKRHAARASRTLRGRALVAASSENEETTTIITNNGLLRPLRESSGAFYTLVPIRPRRRGERRSLRTFPAVSPPPGSLASFNPDTPRRLSTPLLTPLNSTSTSLCMDPRP